MERGVVKWGLVERVETTGPYRVVGAWSMLADGGQPLAYIICSGRGL